MNSLTSCFIWPLNIREATDHSPRDGQPEHLSPEVFYYRPHCAEVSAEIRDRFTVHYTSTHGTSLNQAEIEIGMFTRQGLGT